MRQAAPTVAGATWEVDDAAPTWVKSDPLPSDMEATRVWREEPSGMRATEIRDFSQPELEPTLVFPLERRVPPAPAPPAPAPQSNFVISVATFAVTATLFALALPWVLSHLP
ncbi:MAG: hypothetical protein IPM35_40280 [Myxococcales bacterium]|nr:hypothetical protein [Myxococcales bacterium]